MNCPSCGAPLLFGSKDCSCGYDSRAEEEPLAIDLSYWEALRVYWRIYWPIQVVTWIASIALEAIRVWLIEKYMIVRLMPFKLAIIVAPTLAMFLFIPWLTSRPYRGFRLHLVGLESGADLRFTLPRRAQVWFFLWWRGLAAALLAWLLNVSLDTALRLLGLFITNWVMLTAGLLVIGPILIQMLVGYQFSDFHLEAVRKQPQHDDVANAQTTTSP